jgi:hypothetical protein
MFAYYQMNTKMEKISLQKEKEIKQFLKQFDQFVYHLHETPSIALKLSLGCFYIKENLNGSWIFNQIAKAQLDEVVKKHKVQNWYVERLKDQRSWAIFATDGNRHLIYSTTLPFASFPLRSCQLWVIDRVAMLLPFEVP